MAAESITSPSNMAAEKFHGSSKDPDDYIFFCNNNPKAYACLGNWYWEREGHKGLDDHLYWCVGQETMYAKAKLFGDTEIAGRILSEREHPGVIKELGRAIRNYDDSVWVSKRHQTVQDAVLGKFWQNPEMGEMLKTTGDKIIVEAHWNDKVWGVGFPEWTADDIRGIKKSDTEFDAGPDEWQGENLLGLVLMQVRSELSATRWFDEQSAMKDTENLAATGSEAVHADSIEAQDDEDSLQTPPKKARPTMPCAVSIEPLTLK